MVLDFLGSALMTTEIVVHNKIELALHHLRPAGDTLTNGTGTTAPHERHGTRRCCSCTVSARRRRRTSPGTSRRGPGRSPRSTSPATASRRPAGGGYTAEILLADADVALGALTDGDPERAIRCSVGASAPTSP